MIVPRVVGHKVTSNVPHGQVQAIPFTAPVAHPPRDGDPPPDPHAYIHLL